MSSPVGIIIPNIWKNKKCLKPPTRYTPLSPSSHGFSPPARTASLALGRFGAEGVVAFVKHSGETFGQFTFGMFLKLTHVEVLVLHLEIYIFELSNCVNSCDSLTLPMNLGCQPMAIIVPNLPPMLEATRLPWCHGPSYEARFPTESATPSCANTGQSMLNKWGIPCKLRL